MYDVLNMKHEHGSEWKWISYLRIEQVSSIILMDESMRVNPRCCQWNVNDVIIIGDNFGSSYHHNRRQFQFLLLSLWRQLQLPLLLLWRQIRLLIHIMLMLMLSYSDAQITSCSSHTFFKHIMKTWHLIKLIKSPLHNHFKTSKSFSKHIST
jgi:hypothetical protein